MTRKPLIWILPLLSIIVLFALELFLGSVALSAKEVVNALLGQSTDLTTEIIVRQARLPRAITAAMAGGGLALCGLLMQRFFQNPLAGPSVLGITSGSSLGVAFIVLLGGGAVAGLSIVLGAFVGAMAVLSIILLFAGMRRSPVTLLIFGLMVGYVVSAAVTLLQAGTTNEALRTFVFWGMGSFADLHSGEVLILTTVVLSGLLLASAMHRQLDLWSLGESYARSMGLNHKRFRFAVLLLTGLLTGVITAYCGPIAFIGLAVPHLARGLWQQGRHAVLIPAVVLSGMAIGLGCDLISRLPGTEGGLPLNAVTSFFGAPVVIAIILKGRKVF